MTQGIVSVRKDLEMVYKIVTGHDGMHAEKLGDLIRHHFQTTGNIPTVAEVTEFAEEAGFGCSKCLVIIECGKKYHEPSITAGPEQDGEDWSRYKDTFNVPQFNPRWKYGTADYVEVVDL